MKVLINAYAMCPGMGSEQGMAWNWCSRMCKYCELYIITEEEYREQIDKVVADMPNIHMHYVPVGDNEEDSKRIRKMCWNQGDYRFYVYYERWQKKVLDVAREIIATERIDLVHQLNMVGFREPGYLWKIEDVPYVWGPMGGMDNIPLNYIHGMGMLPLAKVIAKRIVNNWQIKNHPRVKAALKRADALMGATKGSLEKVKKFHGREMTLVNETGCLYSANLSDEEIEARTKKPTFDIIWVGRFLNTKKLDMALDAICELRKSLTSEEMGRKIQFHIVGSGSEQETSFYKQHAEKVGVNDICIWHGNVPNTEVQQLMKTSDVFFFSSVMETTSTVVMEAIANQLPIVCFDICGMGPVVTENVGRKIRLSSPQQSAKEFAEILKDLYLHPESLVEMAENCKARAAELSWDHKIEVAYGLYEKAVRVRR